MSATLNPEIAALSKEIEQHDREIAVIRASLAQLNKVIRTNIRHAVWQSIALVISICIAIVGGLAYQTSVLNNRFEQIEKRWKESDERFAASSELADKNLHDLLDRSEKNRTPPDVLKQEVRSRRK